MITKGKNCCHFNNPKFLFSKVTVRFAYIIELSFFLQIFFFLFQMSFRHPCDKNRRLEATNSPTNQGARHHRALKIYKIIDFGGKNLQRWRFFYLTTANYHELRPVTSKNYCTKSDNSNTSNPTSLNLFVCRSDSSSLTIAYLDPNDTFSSIIIANIIIIFTPCRRFHRHYLSSLKKYDYTAVGSKSRVTPNVDRPAYISLEDTALLAR